MVGPLHRVSLLRRRAQQAVDVNAESEDEYDVNADGQPVEAPDHVPPARSDSSTTPKIRTQFGRRQTHNEQIIVAPCGLVIARATFYGAEAIRDVAVRQASSTLANCILLMATKSFSKILMV